MGDEETNEIAQLQFEKLQKAADKESGGTKFWYDMVNPYMMQVLLNNPDMSWEEFTESFKAILSQLTWSNCLDDADKNEQEPDNKVLKLVVQKLKKDFRPLMLKVDCKVDYWGVPDDEEDDQPQRVLLFSTCGTFKNESVVTASDNKRFDRLPIKAGTDPSRYLNALLSTIINAPDGRISKNLATSKDIFEGFGFEVSKMFKYDQYLDYFITYGFLAEVQTGPMNEITLSRRFRIENCGDEGLVKELLDSDGSDQTELLKKIGIV